MVARHQGGVARHGGGPHGAHRGKLAVRSKLDGLSSADMGVNRHEDVQPVHPTAEEVAVEEEQAADRERQWATAVRMCMDAARPSERAEWLKDQREHERQEELQERANLQLPSSSNFSGGTAGGGGDGVVWEDSSTAGYLDY